MTYEEKAKEYTRLQNLEKNERAILLGLAYLADSVNKGFKKLAKVIDNISIEVQEEDE
jgi:hypothetical protein